MIAVFRINVCITQGNQLVDYFELRKIKMSK